MISSPMIVPPVIQLSSTQDEINRLKENYEEEKKKSEEKIASLREEIERLKQMPNIVNNTTNNITINYVNARETDRLSKPDEMLHYLLYDKDWQLPMFKYLYFGDIPQNHIISFKPETKEFTVLLEHGERELSESEINELFADIMLKMPRQDVLDEYITLALKSNLQL